MYIIRALITSIFHLYIIKYHIFFIVEQVQILVYPFIRNYVRIKAARILNNACDNEIIFN